MEKITVQIIYEREAAKRSGNFEGGNMVLQMHVQIYAKPKK